MFEIMWAIRLSVLITLGLATAAMAAATVPEEFQGVWAAAQDCKQSFQNILPRVVNRKYAACRVIKVLSLSSGHPGGHTDTIYLNCEGWRSREIWHNENVDGTDFLVTMQFERGAQEGGPSIAIFKRCPEIPLSDVPLSDIPGMGTRR